MKKYPIGNIYIDYDGYDELLKYADKLTRYLKGCLE